MQSIICTLFEGHYHFGLAALANSLYKQGFRGDIYAGYRGGLPDWVNSGTTSRFPNWNGGTTLEITNDFKIHFLPLETDWHLTNYKPIFMLKLWEEFGKGTPGIFYFDPDIAIKYHWEFFETWITHGVSLVHEIACWDMPPTHPIRKGWESIIEKSDRKVLRRLHSYINAGFCGTSAQHIGFLQVWLGIINTAVKYYNFDPCKFVQDDPSKLLGTGDQDALNMAAMCCEVPISEFGPEGMDFISGGWLMTHATGSPKPWKKNYILTALKGRPPASSDRTYWHNANGIVTTQSKSYIKKKQLSISMAAFICRFYKRN